MMPRVDKKQITHWFGCWREHPECALVRIDKLETAMADFCAEIDAKDGWYSRTNPTERLAYSTFKELLAGNEEDRANWKVARENFLAARKAAREALGK
jgi:hypothetical protein